MFQVIFNRASLDEVGTQWAGAEDEGRRNISNAFQQIIKQLSADPYAESESRTDNRRIMFVSPIAVTYEDDQIVNVFTLRLYRAGGV